MTFGIPVSVMLFLAAICSVDAQDRWWPEQALPKTVIRTGSQHDFASPKLAHQMMVQSVAGLAAKAVNEGRGNELVWVDNGNADLDEWFARWRAAHPNVAQGEKFTPWELVDHFQKR